MGELLDRLVDEVRKRTATTEVPPDKNKWVPVVSDLQRQVYYRSLGIVSVHGPVSEMVPAAAYLAENVRGGDVYWVKENRVARWDNVEVYPGITMSEWLYGGPRNTVLMRLDWWALYVVRAAVAAQHGGQLPPFDDPTFSPIPQAQAAWGPWSGTRNVPFAIR